jgi:hypothetical protein
MDRVGGSHPWREKMIKFVSIAVLCVAAASPVFACDRPVAPDSIPDGTTAAMDQMRAAKKSVDAFKSAMEGYLSCEKSPAKIDSAQAELVKVADKFNAQVRAFKSKT